MKKLMVLVTTVATVSCGDYFAVYPEGADLTDFEFKKLHYLGMAHVVCYMDARYIKSNSGALFETGHLEDAEFIFEFLENSTVHGKRLPEKALKHLDEFVDNAIQEYRKEISNKMANSKARKNLLNGNFLMQEVADSKISSIRNLRSCQELSSLTRLTIDEYLSK